MDLITSIFSNNSTNYVYILWLKSVFIFKWSMYVHRLQASIYLLIKNLIVKLSMRFKYINYGFTRPSYGLICSIACFKIY